MIELDQSRINDRLQKYRNILSRDEAKSAALLSCLNEQSEDLLLQDQLYLHVFAPTLISFVEWVLDEAGRAGQKRLYFLARDGYSMYLAAKYICENKGIDIDCRYLKVSRYVLRRAEYHLMGEKCLDRICIGGIDVTFEKIMKRAILTETEAIEIAKRCNFVDRYTEILNYQEIQNLKEVLKGVPEFFEYVYRHSKDAYPDMIGYLKQEGLLDHIPYAIVDSGWIGTQQHSMERLLQSATDETMQIKLYGYYFGLYETPKEIDRGRYRGFYFEPGSHIRRKVHFANSLFEAVFSAPEGTTIGYQKIEGRYVPVENKHGNPNTEVIERQILLLQKYMKEYVEHAKENVMQKSRKPEVLVQNLLSQLMSAPKAFEVDSFGEYLFCDDIVEQKQMQEVAATLSTSDIRNQHFFNKALIMAGLRKEAIHESAWIEGSIVRNGEKVQSNLYHAVLYKYFIYIRKALGRK